jgi:ABC-2 type transport system ATP-binding protein
LRTDSASAIDLAHLAKTYGNVRALSDLTLRVQCGEVFGFLGPNGAGKTTSVKILAGLTRPSAGTGSLLGYRLGDRRARTRIGYLPELFRFPEWLCANEVMHLHARLCRRPIAAHEVEETLGLVGLRARANHRVGTFSKGMQQRLGLAVALLGRPDLVILDEPTSALDPAGRLEVREILHRLRAQGTTVFLNSHLLTEVEHVCDRVAIVTKGTVVAQGSLLDILGARSAVRIRAQADGAALQPLLERFGAVVVEDRSLLVQGVDEARVPEMVQALVNSGACVYAVEPQSATLEERFLELTSERGQ